MFGRGMTISDLISGIIISTVLGLVITVITVLGKLVKRHLGYRRYKQAGNKISYRDYKKLGDDERASERTELVTGVIEHNRKVLLRSDTPGPFPVLQDSLPHKHPGPSELRRPGTL